jgi:hypothetical protein
MIEQRSRKRPKSEKQIGDGKEARPVLLLVRHLCLRISQSSQGGVRFGLERLTISTLAAAKSFSLRVDSIRSTLGGESHGRVHHCAVPGQLGITSSGAGKLAHETS